MKNFKHSLDKIRTPKTEYKLSRKVLFSTLAFLFGFLMGMLSKRLDTTAVNILPAILQSLDLGNFLGMLSGWALMAVIIAVFSRSPLRAGLNVFLFFAGMLLSYCIFSVVFGGFMLDTSYLMIWVAYTMISPLFGCVIWYARGKGAPAIILSAVVIGYFILQAFTFSPTFDYFDLSYQWIGVVVLVIGIAALYVRLKQTLISVGLAIVIAYLLNLLIKVLPFSVPVLSI